jgi:two-component system, NarL family, response regulator NreC
VIDPVVIAFVPIRILVVDDHPVARAGLSRLLSAEGDLEVVGDVGDVDDAAARAELLKPDVVLLDIADGTQITPEILGRSPETKVVLLASDDEGRSVRDAFAAGASGYVLKDAPGAEMVHAVREVAGGRRYVNPDLGPRLAEADAHPDEDADPLSHREREVLRLLALGHTNQEIAQLLTISVRTAESHRAHVLQKLRLSSRAELVRYALAQGLLDETG